ncbi:MAG: imidazole glycerol phosphate synthase subunit HisF [Nitrospirae bacterium]|nr:imidazole glycerol phosphate synthase subunit HisF [Nitrospirota bacterium]MCL5285236.1 imidazole glycerol phosphate synthase subunit HisF [Nitrospirota bacterium]
MLKKRIIPCLDMKGGRVVKGVCFEELRDAGDPVETALLYDRLGADELCFLDIGASVENRGTLFEIVEKTASRVFLPLTVGGGIRSVEEIRRALNSGADKVSLNSAALSNPSLLTEGALRFGSQCIVLAVDVKREGASWRVYSHGGTRPTNRDAIEWILEGVRAGAGEILLTSMDRDGTGEGYDIPLLETVSRAVEVPLIASGGAGSKEDFRRAFEAGADAALAASLFHFGTIDLRDLRRSLYEAGAPVRPPLEDETGERR